jgi:hypothetical protein
MLINLFSSRGWESWGLEHRPLIPERMPVLIDEDLKFAILVEAAPRPSCCRPWPGGCLPADVDAIRWLDDGRDRRDGLRPVG